MKSPLTPRQQVAFGLFLATTLVTASDTLAQQESIGEHYDEPIPISGLGDTERSLNLRQAAIVDLTGDGKPDVAFSATGEDSEGAAPLYIFTSNENGSLDLSTETLILGEIPSTDRGYRQVLSADFNGDGRLDLFMESHGAEPDCGGGSVNCWTGGQNSLLLSNSDGLLENVTTTHLPPYSDFSHGSSLGDFDGDGDLDIWVNNLGGSPLYNPEFSYLLHNDGQGAFSVAADSSNPWQVPITGRNGILPEDEDLAGFWSFTVDSEGDGDIDLGLGFTHEKAINTVLLNDGTGRLLFPEDESYPSLEAFDADTQHALVHDLNGDGLDDLLLHQSSNIDFSQPTLQVLISNGDGTFRDETASRYRAEHEFLISEFQLHDLDNDGHMDLFSNLDFGPNDIRINDGEGNFRRIAEDWVTTDWNWTILDADNDGGTDFLVYGWAGLNLHKMNLPYGPELDGTEDDDRLIGGAHDNIFRGLEGNDVLDGGLGDDELNGGSGDDELIGGKGDDLLIPGNGINMIDGGPGRDGIDYPFSMTLATVQPGESTSIKRSNGEVNDQIKTTEYAHFSDGSIPLPTHPQSDMAALNGIAGLWYDPSLDGEGFNIIPTPSGMVLFFYGYTTEGQRLWLISETFAADVAFEQVLDLTLYEGEGGTFAQPAPSGEALREWGRLKALFDGCGSGRLALQGEDGIKATYQVKLAGITDADCQKEQLAAPSGLAGLWYDSALDGEGYNVIITNTSTVFFFYGYDANGNRLWLISETLTGAPQVGAAANLTVYAADGGTFDAPKPSAQALAEWGDLEVLFNTCTEATATLVGVDGAKTSSLVKLAGITGSSCPES